MKREHKRDWIECPECHEKRFIRIDCAGERCPKCATKIKMRNLNGYKDPKDSPFTWDEDPWKSGRLQWVVTANQIDENCWA